MSAAPAVEETLVIDRRTEPFFYPNEEYATEIPQKVTNKAVDSRVFVPEIYGLAITGIISFLAFIVSLALNYTILSLIFTIPLVGSLLGSGYIRYLKKYGTYH